MMVDVNKVREFEDTKRAIMDMSERRFHVALLADDIHDMKKLFETMISWIGSSRIGLLHTFKEEFRFCSAAQKPLLALQEELFTKLKRDLQRALTIIHEANFDPEKVDHSRILAKIQETIEKIMLNSKEIVSVPGIKRKVA